MRRALKRVKEKRWKSPALPLSQREEMDACRGGESEHFSRTPEIVVLISSPSSACIR